MAECSPKSSATMPHPTLDAIGPVGALLSDWSTLQWAPPTSNQLSETVWRSCSVIGQHCSEPRPQATGCRGETVSWEDSANSRGAVEWWSSGGQWGKTWILLSSLPGLGPAGVLWGPREQAGGCVLQGSRALARATCWPWPRPWGVGEPLPPPHLWPNGSGSPHRTQSMGPGTYHLGILRNLRVGCILGAWLPQW